MKKNESYFFFVIGQTPLLDARWPLKKAGPDSYRDGMCVRQHFFESLFLGCRSFSVGSFLLLFLWPRVLGERKSKLDKCSRKGLENCVKQKHTWKRYLQSSDFFITQTKVLSTTLLLLQNEPLIYLESK
jgi:hypothetical protein